MRNLFKMITLKKIQISKHFGFMYYLCLLMNKNFNQEAMSHTSITWNCKKYTVAKRNDTLYWSWFCGWTGYK